MKGICLILLCALPAAAAPSRHTLEHGGLKRLYWLDAPEKAEGRRWPVVIALHGGGGNAEGMRRKTKFEQLGAGKDFIAVHPEGFAQRRLGKSLATWNVGFCCGAARKKQIDDVGFLSALIDELVDKYDADPKRIYVTGHSNGGMMAYRLACEIPGKIAAIAPVGALVREDSCVQKSPMPVLIVHGVEDDCANYGGGEDCGGCFERFLGLPTKGDNNGACTAVPAHAAKWVAAQGCGKSPETSSVGPATRLLYSGCRAPVVFDAISGHGHGWPGLLAEESSAACRKRPDGFLCRRWRRVIGPYASGYSASAEIWNFFKDKTRRRTAVPPRKPLE